jgi:hypothetical protein
MRCFVISPIGQPGSETREHADDVFECIIEPALKETNVEGRRADHIKDVGRITKQMYGDILSSDFCIALLHGFNPNVFYEMAVAHCSGIPVILLSEKGIDPPFDLKDERVFHYDLRPRSIHRGENIRGLTAMIESVRRLDGARQVPFGDNLTPLNAAAATLPYALKDETNATGEFWLQLISRARNRLCIAGIGFTGWRGIPGMREALGTVAASGCAVRVLTMDAQNPAFGGMLNPDVASSDVAGQAPRLEEVRSWFRGALGKQSQVEVRSLQRGLFFQQTIICDDLALVSPYLYSAGTGFSPCLEITASCPTFAKFLHEFDVLWKANAPSDSVIPSDASASPPSAGELRFAAGNAFEPPGARPALLKNQRHKHDRRHRHRGGPASQSVSGGDEDH